MRIQEMKSGFLHLNKKMEDERPERYFETQASQDMMIDPEMGDVPPLEFDCELDKPCWSVVSFDKMEASGLSYTQASALMNELDSQSVAGLCIITDKAASRMSG